VTADAAQKHAVIILAAVRTEALAERISDQAFRRYVLSLTDNLELPDRPFTVLPGGDAA
jgi:hypothetical protein